MKIVIKYSIGLIILLVSTLFGCETIVDIEIPVEPPKLVVNSTLHPEGYFKVNVTQSRHILASDNYLIVPGARVEVYEDGNLLTVLPDSANGNYISATYKPQPGKTYELRVSKAGFVAAYAAVTVPAATARVMSVALDTIELNDYGFAIPYLRFNVAIDDDGQTENFYQITVFREAYSYEMDYTTTPPTKLDSTLYIEKLYIESRDPGLEDYQDYGKAILFSDKLFNGQLYEMKVLSQIYHEDAPDAYPPKYYVVVANTSESYYLYELSAKLQYWNEGDPFAQPVIVYNNITNGYGILGAYNETTITVD